MIPETLAAYIAGIFDGEGSVYTNRSTRFTLGISIAQLYSPEAESLCMILCDFFDGRYDIINDQGRKTIAWRLTKATSIVFFLKTIEPYIILKRKQLHIAFAIAETISYTNAGTWGTNQFHSILETRKLLAEQLRNSYHSFKNQQTNLP